LVGAASVGADSFARERAEKLGLPENGGSQAGAWEPENDDLNEKAYTIMILCWKTKYCCNFSSQPDGIGIVRKR